MHQQPGKTWWGRNWKWFLPVGCLGALVLFAGFIASIMFVTFGVMKSSDAYKDAVAKARAHPAVQESIGTPIEEGLVVTGNIHVSGSSGNADLSIPYRAQREKRPFSSRRENRRASGSTRPSSSRSGQPSRE
jgi:hypothetical protein